MIHVVLGTKAQLIKMAPIMKKMAERGVPYNYISTGQHRDTMDEIHDNFGIKKPDVVLYDGPDITSIAKMLTWAIRILLNVFRARSEVFKGTVGRNGIVLVHGDTFSTALGAVMGRVAGLQVAHVESGLRSFNIFEPFPEELTRIATFLLSTVYFCPGQWAQQNLARFRGEKVDTKYNTLLDALRCARPVLTRGEEALYPKGPYGIVTIHRYENIFDEARLRLVIDRVELVARHMRLAFILHKPTRQNLERYGLLGRLEANPNVELRPRYDYFKFMQLMQRAEFVISDGGSNQEECFYLGKPVLLFREVTERQEGLGRNAVLSKFDPTLIEAFVKDYPKYRHPFLEVEESPSDLIVDYCVAATLKAKSRSNSILSTEAGRLTR